MNYFKNMMTFIEVVEKESFTLAASALQATPTAVSQQIKRLEEYLGIVLVYRTTRSFEITELGRNFYLSCKKLQQQMRDTETEVISSKSEPAGQLNIVVHSSVGYQLLSSSIIEFKMLYPKLSLDIKYTDDPTSSYVANADMIIGFSIDYANFSMPEHLVAHKFISAKPYLVAAPDYLKRHGTPKSLEELSHHLFIAQHLRSPEHMIDQYAGVTIQLPKPHILVNTVKGLSELALSGAGIAIQTFYMVNKYLQSGQLVQISIPEIEFRPIDFYIFYRSEDRILPKISHLLKFIHAKTQEVMSDDIKIMANDAAY